MSTTIDLYVGESQSEICMVTPFRSSNVQVKAIARDDFGNESIILPSLVRASMDLPSGYTKMLYDTLKSPFGDGYEAFDDTKAENLILPLNYAIRSLGDEMSDDFYMPEEGNMKEVFKTLRSWALQHKVGYFARY